MRKVIDYSRLKDMKASAIYKADLVMFDKTGGKEGLWGQPKKDRGGGDPPLL